MPGHSVAPGWHYRQPQHLQQLLLVRRCRSHDRHRWRVWTQGEPRWCRPAEKEKYVLLSCQSTCRRRLQADQCCVIRTPGLRQSKEEMRIGALQISNILNSGTELLREDKVCRWVQISFNAVNECLHNSDWKGVGREPETSVAEGSPAGARPGAEE